MTEPDWKSCANRHLLAHVMKQAGRKVYYCHLSDTVRVGPSTKPHPLTVELTNVLMAYAHNWALDMADWPSGRPTAQEQREAWNKSMEQADRECRAIRERTPAGARTEESPDNTLQTLLTG